MRAVLVSLLELLRVLAEALAALLASERHLERRLQWVRLRFVVAVGAVEPLVAAWRPDADLRVEDVLATGGRSRREEGLVLVSWGVEVGRGVGGAWGQIKGSRNE
jgi:hypothetical protein